MRRSSSNDDGEDSYYKLDQIVNTMRRQNIDVYFIQETWLEGTDEHYRQIEIDGYTCFLHGNKETTCSRGKGGVGIILSERGKQAWTNAGGNKPDIGDEFDCARFIGLNLKFSDKQKNDIIYIASVYHPHDQLNPLMIDQFHDKLDERLQRAKATNNNTSIIVGADTNSHLGTNESEDDNEILGRFGLQKRGNNANEHDLKKILFSNDLRVSTTDFPHKKYQTWTSFGNMRGLYQIDHFITSNAIRARITDARRVETGVDSDHSAIKLKLRLVVSSKCKKKSKAPKKIIPDWDLLKQPKKELAFQAEVDRLLAKTQRKNVKSLNSAIMEAAKATIPRCSRNRKDWFKMSQKILFAAIQARNKTFSELSSDPTNAAKQDHLRKTRKTVKYIVKLAKAKNQEKFAKDTSAKSWTKNPKKGWDAVRVLSTGCYHHHAQPTAMKMKLPNGALAENDKENADVFDPHFQRIFNGDTPHVDIPSILKKIPQKTTMSELGNPPTKKEFDTAIKNMANGKAPGDSKIPAEPLKALSDDAKETLLEILVECFKGNTDPEEWHTAILRCLHKKKDPSNPANWRGICLKDMTARLMSSIMNSRLLTIIGKHGTETQYGSQSGRGSTDGTFVLRSAVQTRRQHNLPTWVLFADLVKAFDTVNHELMLALIEHYGAPKELVRIIKMMYTDVSVKLQVGKEKRLIPYTVGVQQGDNMAPVLFLFVMQAFSDTLKERFSNAGIDDGIDFKFFKTTKTHRGRLLNQNKQAKGTDFNLRDLLYVDDGAFFFTTKEALQGGSEIIKEHFETFGLKMHFGQNGGESKTEAMFFPASLKDNTSENNDVKIPLRNTDGGYITTTNSFKYLGSTITPDLHEDVEIRTRINKGTAQVSMMIKFYRAKNISLKTKRNIFIATAINTVLWGCESWTMSESNCRRLISFQHKCIRRILNINMFQVERDRIKNETVRKRFDNIPHILDLITLRQANWIGKIAKMNDERMPRKLLASWVNNPRKVGRPQLCYRQTFTRTINSIVDSDYNGTLKLWMPQATTDEWTKKIAEWWTAVYPTTDLDLAANSNLAQFLNSPQMLPPNWHAHQ
jgi:exonuclease III